MKPSERIHEVRESLVAGLNLTIDATQLEKTMAETACHSKAVEVYLDEQHSLQEREEKEHDWVGSGGNLIFCRNCSYSKSQEHPKFCQPLEEKPYHVGNVVGMPVANCQPLEESKEKELTCKICKDTYCGGRFHCKEPETKEEDHYCNIGRLAGVPVFSFGTEEMAQAAAEKLKKLFSKQEERKRIIEMIDEMMWVTKDHSNPDEVEYSKVRNEALTSLKSKLK